MNLFQPQFPGFILVAGLILSGCGLLYRIPAIQYQDLRFFHFLYLKLSTQVPFFRLLWPLGKTPFMMFMLGVLFFSGWTSGFLTALFYAVIACLERVLKLMVKRQRPFSALPDIQMSQPAHPRDPSHPSGDAMRIWYLTFVLPVAFGLSLPVVFLFCLIAVPVSLGRIALGVHFPLDVIGGIGLGLVGAGLYRLCL